jgi:4-amino-4-deoxy-L-arabinose transferase-like glycosyltransferase
MNSPSLTRNDFLSALGLALGATLSYQPFLGAVPLLDWDELIYGEAAREMVTSGNFLQVYVNYQPFWEKPPLYFWLQAICFQLFGVSEAAARIPTTLFFGFTLGLIFLFGTWLKGRAFGLGWAGLFGSALLPVFYSRYGIIDPVFNFFVIVAVLSLFLWDQGKGSIWVVLAALAVGLAVTTKGPLALVLVFGIFAIYKLWQWEPRPSIVGIILFVGGSLALASTWFVAETLTHGPWFIESFILYQQRISSTDDGHPGPIFYHALVFLLGCFPYSPFVVGGMLLPTAPALARFKKLALVWFTFVFCLFSFLVQTKLPHYASLLYLPGSFFAALRIEQLYRKRQRPHFLELILLGTIGILVATLCLLLPYVGQHVDILEPYLKQDPLALGYLHAGVVWSNWTYLPGIMLLIGLLAAAALFIRQQPLSAMVALASCCFVGMNAAVTKTLPRGAVALGQPAEIYLEDDRRARAIKTQFFR